MAFLRFSNALQRISFGHETFSASIEWAVATNRPIIINDNDGVKGVRRANCNSNPRSDDHSKWHKQCLLNIDIVDNNPQISPVIILFDVVFVSIFSLSFFQFVDVFFSFRVAHSAWVPPSDRFNANGTQRKLTILCGHKRRIIATNYMV